MWNHIKDVKPMGGKDIEILHRNKVLKCFVAETTVYNSANNKILKIDDLELWRYPQKEKKAS